MRRGAALALALVLLGLVGSLWPPRAEAADITGTVERVSWWTKRLGAQPTVQANSFEVAFGTDAKPTSVAAIDVAVPVGPVQTLSIELSELTGTAAQIGHIQVCLAAPGWGTANGGPFAQAPAIDCTAPADLTRSLDGNWLGDIAGLVPNGGTASLGVILVNDLDAPITPGATVQIAGITISGQTSDEPLDDGGTATTIPDPGGGVDGSIVDPGVIPPPAGGFELPPVSPPGSPPEAVEEPIATTTTLPPDDEFAVAVAFDTDPTPWWRLVILVPLALGIGFAAVFARRFLEARNIAFG